MATVSIIIPNYNHGKFLERRIQSVLNQTYQDFEVILLDDASTDNSREIIETFRNSPRFKIILNDENSGSVFKQWKRGIDNADGKYIWIAESDDEASPELLETLVRQLDKSKSIVLAYCQSLAIDSEGNILYPLNHWTDDLDKERWKHDFINYGHDECKHYLVVKNTIPNASAVVFRKDSFVKYYIASDMTLCGDWLTWSSMLFHGDIYYCANLLNYFRHHCHTVRETTSLTLLQYEGITVTRHILSHSNINIEEQRLISYRLLLFWCLLLRNTHWSIILSYFTILFTLSPINAGKLVVYILLCHWTSKLSRICRRIEEIPDCLYRKWASKGN